MYVQTCVTHEIFTFSIQDLRLCPDSRLDEHAIFSALPGTMFTARKMIAPR